jgi:hypothetical protein
MHRKKTMHECEVVIMMCRGTTVLCLTVLCLT